MINIKKIISSIGFSISHVFLTLLIFLLIILGLATTFHDFFDFNNLKENVSSVPIDKVLGNNETKIYDYLNKIGLSKEKIYTFLDKNGFKNILSENLSSKMLNKVENFEIKLPNEDQVTDFIYDNLEYVKKIFIFETSRDDIKRIVHKNYEFIDNLVEDVSDKVDLSGLENLKVIPKLIKNGTVKIIIIGIAISVIIIIICRASLYKWLMWIHVATLVVGILFSLIGVFGNKLFVFLAEKLKIMFLVDPFVNFFNKRFVKYGIILLIISLITFVLHYLIKKIVKKSNKKVGRNLSET